MKLFYKTPPQPYSIARQTHNLDILRKVRLSNLPNKTTLGDFKSYPTNASEARRPQKVRPFSMRILGGR